LKLHYDESNKHKDDDESSSQTTKVEGCSLASLERKETDKLA
jgi:hypothetical protein